MYELRARAQSVWSDLLNPVALTVTPPQIFRMPYVQESMHRYKAMEQHALLKRTNTIARRQQLLEKSQGDDTVGRVRAI